MTCYYGVKSGKRINEHIEKTPTLVISGVNLGKEYWEGTDFYGRKWGLVHIDVSKAEEINELISPELLAALILFCKIENDSCQSGFEAIVNLRGSADDRKFIPSREGRC
jgi:hypothetical protein